MTELDKTVKDSGRKTTKGLIVARVDVVVSTGLSFNTARAAGKAALLVVNSRDIHSSAVHTALRIGGHSTKTARGGFLRLVPASGELENSLQELPDGTSIHIAEEPSKDPFIEAPKTALIQGSEITSLPDRGISRRFIMNVFSTSHNPNEYGLQELLIENDLEKAA